MEKYLSRQFLVTIALIGLVSALPIKFKLEGVTDPVCMFVLAILASVGVSYGVVDYKNTKAKAIMTAALGDAPTDPQAEEPAPIAPADPKAS